MIALGLSDTQFDSGVALAEDGRLLWAANEERYTRVKNQGGFPQRALAALFERTGLSPRDVGLVCVGGIMNPPLPARLFPALARWGCGVQRERRRSPARRLLDALVHASPLVASPPDSWLGRASRPWLAPLVRARLPAGLDAPIRFVEHHRAHAWGAWAHAGEAQALCLTADGLGDGASLTVGRGGPAGLERLYRAGPRDSLGAFYELITEALGFVPYRDEGKVVGLAAYGDARAIAVPFPFEVRDGRPAYLGRPGLAGVLELERETLAGRRREDVAAWAQEGLERCLIELARHWLGETGLKRLAVSGGVFANVKANQRLLERSGAESLFVCPNMGDAGLAHGALCAEGALAPARLEHAFWGDGFPEDRLAAALRAAGLPFERAEDPEALAARLLADGRVVARFSGRMEWGPRALGNRSILAPARDPRVASRLNRALRRSDFMPFAPAVLAEEADRWFTGASGAAYAAEFMTVCLPCTPEMRRAGAAAVHVDGTARPQLVAGSNPGLRRVLELYGARAGEAVLLNTSFNLHEEPIVRAPEEAVDAFLRAGLDALLLGPFAAYARQNFS